MRTHAWKTIGKLLFATAVGMPLFVPMPAEAATRTKRVVGGALDNAVCTLAGDCATARGEGQLSDGDRKLGTAITWMQTPDAAWRAAADERKLVFMIQVSGNFARQEFT
ncbi:MAG TPA: hypothetical protein VMV10_04700 [Pirellulales bacterium]|nr:hypothetical protein [Pirellulales bacterium]